MSDYWKLGGAFAAGLGAATVLVGGLCFLRRRREDNKSYSVGSGSGEIEKYLSQHNKENATLSQLRQISMAHAQGVMTSRVESGKLLTLLCRSIKAKKVLDIGVFTGVSAFAMALGLPDDGKVIACDVSKEFTSIGQPYWEKGGVADKIDLRIQPATNTLQELIDNGEEGTFDLMFIDADKENYPTYFEFGLKLLRPGGLFMVDNALWSGYVANKSKTDKSTEAIRKINLVMRDDPRVDYVLLNVADGTGLAMKL